MTPISWIRSTLRGLVAVVAAVAVVADGPLDDIDHFLVAWRIDDKATEGEREDNPHKTLLGLLSFSSASSSRVVPRSRDDGQIGFREPRMAVSRAREPVCLYVRAFVRVSVNAFVCVSGWWTAVATGSLLEGSLMIDELGLNIVRLVSHVKSPIFRRRTIAINTSLESS